MVGFLILFGNVLRFSDVLFSNAYIFISMVSPVHLRDMPFVGHRCYCIGGLFRSIPTYVFRVVYCGQTVQDRPLGCIEIELECGDDISIGTIFDLLGPP